MSHVPASQFACAKSVAMSTTASHTASSAATALSSCFCVNRPFVAAATAASSCFAEQALGRRVEPAACTALAGGLLGFHAIVHLGHAVARGPAPLAKFLLLLHFSGFFWINSKKFLHLRCPRGCCAQSVGGGSRRWAGGEAGRRARGVLQHVRPSRARHRPRDRGQSEDEEYLSAMILLRRRAHACVFRAAAEGVGGRECRGSAASRRRARSARRGLVNTISCHSRAAPASRRAAPPVTGVPRAERARARSARCAARRGRDARPQFCLCALAPDRRARAQPLPARPWTRCTAPAPQHPSQGSAQGATEPALLSWITINANDEAAATKLVRLSTAPAAPPTTPRTSAPRSSARAAGLSPAVSVALLRAALAPSDRQLGWRAARSCWRRRRRRRARAAPASSFSPSLHAVALEAQAAHVQRHPADGGGRVAFLRADLRDAPLDEYSVFVCGVRRSPGSAELMRQLVEKLARPPPAGRPRRRRLVTVGFGLSPAARATRRAWR